MTQRSKFWNGLSTGDALEAPYDAPTEFAAVMRDLSVVGGTVNLSGVFHRVLNELAPTAGVGVININTGRAMVYGTWYESDGVISMPASTPSGANRFDRIVLRKDWSAQTIRLLTLTGVEGGIVPLLTQVVGGVWDMNICSYLITTAGSITVTDERNFLPFLINPVVQVYNSTIQPIPASDAQIALAWDTNLYITDASMHSVSVLNSRLFAPRAGLYDFFGSIRFSFSSGAAERTSTVSLRKNGTTYFSTSTIYTPVSVPAAVVYVPINAREVLAPGDYVEVMAHQSSVDTTTDVYPFPLSSPKFGMRWLQPMVGY